MIKRASLSACAWLVLMGACDGTSKVSRDTGATGPIVDAGMDSARLDVSGMKDSAPSVVVDTRASDSTDANRDVLIVAVDTASPREDAGTNVPRPDARTDLAIALLPDAGAGGRDVGVDAPAPKDTADVKADAPAIEPVDAGTPVYDGGLGSTCIKGLFDFAVLRGDGVLLDEFRPQAPQVVLDDATGLPLRGVVGAKTEDIFGCAALENGTAVCWQGDGTTAGRIGALGNGSLADVPTHWRATPVLTGPGTPLTNVVAMAAGRKALFSCAITSDGRMWCWGQLTWVMNQGTQLLTGYAQPVTLDGTTPLTKVVAAATIFHNACAIVAGTPNSLWCWGANESGQLGQGDVDPRPYPVKVPGLTNPTQVAIAASPFSVATACVVDGGRVMCWGNNVYGQVGTGKISSYETRPTTIPLSDKTPLDGVVDISAGYSSFTVLRTDATLWGWGSGYELYAVKYGPPKVLAIGWAGPESQMGPRFLTSDGVLHNGSGIVPVNCD